MLHNIAYKEYKKSNDIHGTILYPAVMVAPVQKDVLSKIIETNDVSSIFDPFYGSGTALYEAMEISQELHLVGCDINPLAHMITKVKLQGVNSRIHRDIQRLKSLIENPQQLYPLSFPNMEKWYREDIIESLTLIRSAIIQIDDFQNRLFFWYILCDIIRRYSNTRSSTYKLHIKEVETISKMENRVIESFLSSIDLNTQKFLKQSKNFVLYKCDTLAKLNDFDDRSFDVSITSPPYGDNATTVTYGQFSMLALYTISQNDLELDGWELDNYSTIDSNSMGGMNAKSVLESFEKTLLEPYLNCISATKHRKIIRFFADYFNFLNQLCRVTDKYIVLTLGNRTVDRIQINLTEITKAFLERKDFPNIQTASREIPIKRTPKITSKVYQKSVSSMNHEYVIIHKRKNL